jgi:formylglycine-generating enzyme required for sulfatase activity
MKLPTLLTVALLAPLSHSLADAFGNGTNAFMLEFASIGDTGNAAGSSGYGSVAYDFRMSTEEVSESVLQRAVNAGMVGVTAGAWIGDQPAAFIDWFEAAAFVNFLNTDRGLTPAYDLSWDGESWSMNLWTSADAWQLGGENLYRHKDAFYFLPSEDEWFKAAYYKGGGASAGYWDYPTQENAPPTAVPSGVLAGTAVYDGQSGPAEVFNNGGLSPYGSRGMGGNAAEWTESAWDGLNNSSIEDRTVRGVDWFASVDQLGSFYRDINAPLYESDFIGFRVASVPEPSTMALILLTGVAARLWHWRLRRDR